MSSYQLNNWMVHPAQCEIVDQKLGSVVQLEPQLMKLLTYLVERRNEVVTRDELAEAIWAGLAIEDNTISRAITRLRKTLNDDYRQPQYIKTVPKRGYRLVADILERPAQAKTDKELADNSNIAYNHAKTAISNRFQLLLIVTSIVVVALVVFIKLQTNSNTLSPATRYDTKPLSSKTGREYSPSFSADGSHFVFVGNHHSETWLYIQERGQDSAVPLVQLNDSNTKPQWSPLKDSIIYSEQTGNRCELILLEGVTSSSMTQTKLLTCQQKMRMRPDWDRQNYAIHYIENNQVEQLGEQANENESAANLIHFDLNTKQKEPLEIAQLEGELIYAKYSPNGNYLGLLSKSTDQNLNITLLNSKSKVPFAKLSLSYAIEDFVWHPNGDSIVHVGEHPSHRVIRHFLDGTQISIAASEIGYLDEVRAIGSSQNFAVTSLYLDRDLVLLNEDRESLIIDSAYPDYSGIYSHTESPESSFKNQSLAFASKRSGRAQIWVKRSDGSIYQLSRFENSYYIYDIVWSPDNKRLMVRANNDVYVFDVSNGRAQKLALAHQQPKLLGWYDEEQVYYITKEQNLSSLFLFDIENQKTQLLNRNVSQAFYQASSQSWFYSTNQSNTIFTAKASKKPKESSELDRDIQSFEMSTNNPAIYQSRNKIVNWQVFNGSVYVVEKQPDTELETLTEINNRGERRLLLSRQRIGYFAPLGDDGVLVTKVTSNESNIIELIAQ